jgi:DNA-binding beta-propeller fold protein YncE
MIEFNKWLCALFLVTAATLDADVVFIYREGNSDNAFAIDLATNTVVATISGGGLGNQGLIPPIALTPDGAFVYTGSGDGLSNTLRVIRIETLEVEATIAFGTGTPLSNIVFTPTDGQLAYVGDASNTYVIDTAARAVVATLPMPASISMVMAPDGSYLFLANETPASFLVSLPTYAVVATLPPADSAVATSDSAIIYARGINTEVFKIDALTGAIVQTIPVDTSGTELRAIVMTSDGQYVYAAGDTVSVIDRSLMPDSVIATIPIAATIHGVPAVSPDNAFLCFAAGTGVEVVDVAMQAVVATLSLLPVSVENVLLSPDGLSLFAFYSSGTLWELDTATLSEITTFANVSGTRSGGVYWVGSLPPPPMPSVASPKGRQLLNRFLSQSDRINVISWSAPTDFTPIVYRIYRDAALTQLAGEVAASYSFFQDHNRKKGRFYSYYIVAIDGTGAMLDIGSITVTPIL